jgi:hypothetical protein
MVVGSYSELKVQLAISRRVRTLSGLQSLYQNVTDLGFWMSRITVKFYDFMLLKFRQHINNIYRHSVNFTVNFPVGRSDTSARIHTV